MAQYATLMQDLEAAESRQGALNLRHEELEQEAKNMEAAQQHLQRLAEDLVRSSTSV